MSRKHAHRADNAPASRRYVRSVVQRARDDILSAIVHGPAAEITGIIPFLPPGSATRVTGPSLFDDGSIFADWSIGGEFPPQIEADRIRERLERYAGPIGKES